MLGFLERAVDAKATIVTGGGAIGDRGFFVKPTIVADVAQDAEIVQNEVFGPVVTDAALRLRRRGDRDGERRPLRARLVGVLRERRAGDEGRRASSTSAASGSTSTCSRSRSEMPHGGFKESGYGKDMSMYSMEEYTRIKHVCVKLA